MIGKSKLSGYGNSARAMHLLAICFMVGCSDALKTRNVKSVDDDVVCDYRAVSHGESIIECWTYGDLFRPGDPIDIGVRISERMEHKSMVVTATLIKDNSVIIEDGGEFPFEFFERRTITNFDSTNGKYEAMPCKHAKGIEGTLRNAFHNHGSEPNIKAIPVGRYDLKISVKLDDHLLEVGGLVLTISNER
jgi:hypothetical protein